jgi:hypothetical protein
VRNATGLVRELSAFDAFNLVFSAVLIPVAITEVMAFTPMFWPHANMLLSFLFATPLVLTCGLVYLYFTLIMPRSGGDLRDRLARHDHLADPDGRRSHGHFVANWNAHSGTTYNAIISKARGLGFSSAGGIGWTATLFGMIYCFQRLAVWGNCTASRYERSV